MNKTILFLFFCFLSFEAFAAKYYRLQYQVRQNENFSMILKRFVKIDSFINIKSPTVKKTMKKNPAITNWRKLTPGTSVELFIEDKVMDLAKYQEYEDELLQKIAEAEEEALNKTNLYPEGFKASFFYMASLGIFTQETPTVAKMNFYQNSPISLGTSFSYYPKQSKFSYSGSLYYSKLTASVADISNESVDIPPELGANGYLEYRVDRWKATLYGGADYETFSTFNMEGLQNDKKIYVDDSKALYATLGFSKSYQFFNRNFFFKTSISKSLSTTYKKNAPPPTIQVSDFRDEGAYDGMKYLIYLNYKFSDRFFLHSLFKYHSMTGPSELTTLRIGLGFGYVLY